MTMEAFSYSLRQTVFGIFKTLVARASQNNLDLTYDVELDNPNVRSSNLVVNTIKFMPSRRDILLFAKDKLNLISDTF